MRWLLSSWGSQGDLHPFLTLGRALLTRGHQVTLVGHPEWGAETAAAGLRFVSTREPARDRFLQTHPEVMSTRWGGLPGLRTLMEHAIVPSFEPTLAALRAEADSHDVIIAHHFVFAAAAAAELHQKPRVTVFLAPGVIPSAYSRPAPNFGRAGSGALSRSINAFIWNGGRFITRRMVDPAVNRFRAQHGLTAIRGAVFDAPAADLDLLLYSEHFAPRPPDWPAIKQPTGFCLHDPPDAPSLPAEVEEFLASGDQPILFTLGSFAVQMPGDFYRAAVDVLVRQGRRGILLVGEEANRPAHLPPSILALSYAPYGLLMPRVRAVVHQCGVGTMAHALRAGLPSVCCPFAFDQPNNSRRLEALGVAEVVLPHQRKAEVMGAALQRLLAGDASHRAAELGAAIRAEDGPARACTLLEKKFGASA